MRVILAPYHHSWTTLQGFSGVHNLHSTILSTLDHGMRVIYCLTYIAPYYPSWTMAKVFSCVFYLHSTILSILHNNIRLSYCLTYLCSTILPILDLDMRVILRIKSHIMQSYHSNGPLGARVILLFNLHSTILTILDHGVMVILLFNLHSPILSILDHGIMVI